MDDDSRSYDAREKRHLGKAILGLALMGIAALTGGTVALLLGIAGGIVLGLAVCKTCLPSKGKACPPCSWPLPGEITASDATPAVRLDPPQPIERWIERTARTEAATRGR